MDSRGRAAQSADDSTGAFRACAAAAEGAVNVMTLPAGVCCFCGCSEYDACRVDVPFEPATEPCSWTDRTRSVCTVCAPAAKAEAIALRTLAKAGYRSERPGIKAPLDFVAAFHQGFVVGWFGISPRSPYSRNPFIKLPIRRMRRGRKYFRTYDDDDQGARPRSARRRRYRNRVRVGVVADAKRKEREDRKMSWSFQAVGKPSAVVKAIEESSNNKLTDQSLKEWLEAKPALIALVGANLGNVVRVNANGHASFELPAGEPGKAFAGPAIDHAKKTQGQCSCVIESFYGFVE
jgi:hypothetical protein